MRSVLGMIGATVVLGVACSGGVATAPAPTAPPTETTAEATAAPPAPTPTAPAVEGTVVDIAPRSVVYGGVVFTPRRAEISNEDPTSRENGLGLPSTQTYLHLDVGVQNPMAEGILTLDPQRFFGLRLAGNIVTAPVLSDDIAPVSAVPPGTDGSMRASWEVPEDVELADAALVIGPPDAQQVVLALAGLALTAPPQERAVPLALSGPVDGMPACGPTRLDVTAAIATLSVDLPADVADTGGLPRRALVDHLFVEVTVDLGVAAVDGTEECTGTVVAPELVRLTSNDAPVPEGWVRGASGVVADVGETVTLTVGSMVRVDAQVAVTVGEPDGSTLVATFTAR